MARTKTGPNDTRCVIWTLGAPFFFSSHFLRTNEPFLLHLGFIYVLKAQGGLGWAARTKTGPNDARCVVWTPGMSFSFFFVFFLY